MSKINVHYMTDQAADTLKNNIAEVTKKLIANPRDSVWINDFVEGKVYQEKKFRIEQPEFEMPSSSEDHTTEYKNAIKVYEAFKELPQYVLSDELFWLWVHFELGYKECLKMMPVKEKGSVFKDHWLFTQGKRRGLLFGVWSRCYYRVLLSKDDTLQDPYELTKFVFDNPERFRNLTWRTFSSARHVIIGALKAEKKVLDELGYGKEKNKYYPELAKSLSMFGSVAALDAMTEQDVYDHIYTTYKEMIANG